MAGSPYIPAGLNEHQAYILEQIAAHNPAEDSSDSQDPLSAPPPATPPRASIQSLPPKQSTPQQRIAVVISGGTPQHKATFSNVQESTVFPPAKRVKTAPNYDVRTKKSAYKTSESAGTSGFSSPARPGSENGPAGMNRRGRPKGWKPGIKYSDLRPKVAKPAPSGTGKRRGRPPKVASPPPRVVYSRLDVDFTAFLCEWEGCQAELHNLATLRKHVYVVHGDEERCLWGTCATAEDEDDEETRLDNDEEFELHMEGEHLGPFAWHTGDGPGNDKPVVKRKNDIDVRNGDGGGDDMAGVEFAKRDLPGWLFGKDGRQVTASVEGQQVEDWHTWKANRKRLKELLIRRDANLPSEDEEEDDDKQQGEAGQATT